MEALTMDRFPAVGAWHKCPSLPTVAAFDFLSDFLLLEKIIKVVALGADHVHNISLTLFAFIFMNTLVYCICGFEVYLSPARAHQ